ncbi:hypothetical protein [Bacteroides sp.]|uniref:hyaluronate lyase N-terminal domain-containing protein n=1 Tax=Bacteroides sp. TaxID=29523 RepID=UPI00261A6A00|nr:hypothetical protein [Bacteroides sp.]MDD3039598.1 hypothetical protein [Bacteroides sp.]
MSAIFQLRRDTSANWTSYNPIPREGEPCVETDTRKMKIGDGTTAWNSLDYLVSPTTVSDDVNPVLGGDLDCSEYEVQLHNNPIRFYTSGDGHVTTLGIGANVADLAFTLPPSYGTTRQVLQSDGTGTLAFSWRYDYLERMQLGAMSVGNLMYFVAERDMEIVSAKMYLRVAPEYGLATVDVRLGTNDSAHSILNGNSMSISYDATPVNGIYVRDGSLITNPTVVTQGQVVWFAVLSAGVGGMTPGQDLTVKLTYR